MAWILTLGIAAATATSAKEKGAVTLVLLIGQWHFSSFAMIASPFFPIAALALIWVPSVPLPRIFANALRMVAGASLIIYLTHFQVFSVAHRLIGGDHAGLLWLAAIIGGVVGWRLYDPVDAWLNRRIRAFLTSAG